MLSLLRFLKPEHRLRKRSRRPAPPATPRLLCLPAVAVPVEVKVSARARRLSMRVDPVRNLVRVSAPPFVEDEAIAGFVDRHAAWLAQRLASVPPHQPFTDGALVPILGVDHVIRHVPARRVAAHTAMIDGQPTLLVGGEGEFLSRRVTDFLKGEARRQMAGRARAKAAQLGVAVAGVSVRDTRSRWGSCSAGRRLSFSWRLILAPEWVLDYVVAHEVAHLREMNHSPRFWALCATLNGQVAQSREWLRLNGARLHRYG